MPVGWNWKNSMSSSGMPRRKAIAGPSPVRAWAFEETLEHPAVAAGGEQDALAWKTWSSPVAIS